MFPFITSIHPIFLRKGREKKCHRNDHLLYCIAAEVYCLHTITTSGWAIWELRGNFWHQFLPGWWSTVTTFLHTRNAKVPIRADTKSFGPFQHTEYSYSQFQGANPSWTHDIMRFLCHTLQMDWCIDESSLCRPAPFDMSMGSYMVGPYLPKRKLMPKIQQDCLNCFNALKVYC